MLVTIASENGKTKIFVEATDAVAKSSNNHEMLEKLELLIYPLS